MDGPAAEQPQRPRPDRRSHNGDAGQYPGPMHARQPSVKRRAPAGVAPPPTMESREPPAVPWLRTTRALMHAYIAALGHQRRLAHSAAYAGCRCPADTAAPLAYRPAILDVMGCARPRRSGEALPWPISEGVKRWLDCYRNLRDVARAAAAAAGRQPRQPSWPADRELLRGIYAVERHTLAMAQLARRLNLAPSAAPRAAAPQDPPSHRAALAMAPTAMAPGAIMAAPALAHGGPADAAGGTEARTVVVPPLVPSRPRDPASASPPEMPHHASDDDEEEGCDDSESGSDREDNGSDDSDYETAAGADASDSNGERRRRDAAGAAGRGCAPASVIWVDPGRQEFRVPGRPPRVHPPGKRRRTPYSPQVRERLRAWILAHADHPYPTPAEKEQLMAATGLSLVQLNNWLINGRRRVLPPRAPESASAAASAASAASRPQASVPSSRSSRHRRRRRR